jgi:hypothetical protein
MVTPIQNSSISGEGKKNFIIKLWHNHGWVTSHDEKQLVAQQHFSEAIGRGEPRSISLN